MYLLLQKKIDSFIPVLKKLNEDRTTKNKEKTLESLESFSQQELIILRALSTIGNTQVGYRYIPSDEGNFKTEIIPLPLKEEKTAAQLMEEYTKFLKYRSPQSLMHYFLHNTNALESLQIGLDQIKTRSENQRI